MKRFLPIVMMLCSITFLKAQTTVDFEDFQLPQDSFLNNGEENNGFESSGIFLPNTFTASDFGDFWSGWSISTMRDSVTSGFMNQYSAITGSGFDGSATYAVGFGANILELTGEAAGSIISGMYLTNSTYAHNSMRDGDAFSKRFGGESGNDPDFFQLIIRGYSAGELGQDSVAFLLADYRFEDNSQDYIVDTWEFIDLTSLGSVDSLQFSYESSDVGDFGINTPTYICVDNIILDRTVNTQAVQFHNTITLYPNPTSDFVHIKSTDTNPVWQLFNIEGRLIKSGKSNSVNIMELSNGLYFMRIANQAIMLPIVKQ